ncbi:14804_t:CDS:2 [Acaulospora morrowiae]|uniref:14804_t:CDS:1 n=1 Tax=Acaulospora morrowiae TaxID=94023 RepID=A0A9N8WDK7_9GLOM|nr:14804_t:CDS:2 [Acaulospora morrowiae]
MSSLHEWQPAGPEDKRSPCPALNSLANHGYLPRDGRDITPEQLEKVLQRQLNFSWFTSFMLTRLSFLVIGKTLAGKLDLDDLYKHNAIEHDASLTRNDFALGGSHQVNPKLIDHLLSFNVDGKIGVESLSKYRINRIKDSEESNKDFKYGFNQRNSGSFEISLLLSTLGSETNRIVDVKNVDVFLRKEGFPEGWEKAKNAITIPYLFSTFRKAHKLLKENEKKEA